MMNSHTGWPHRQTFRLARNCHSIGVNVTANFEMPTSVQAPACASTASETPNSFSRHSENRFLELRKRLRLPPTQTIAAQRHLCSKHPIPIIGRNRTPRSIVEHLGRIHQLRIVTRLRNTVPRIRQRRQSKSWWRKLRRSLIQRSLQFKHPFQCPSRFRRPQPSRSLT